MVPDDFIPDAAITDLSARLERTGWSDQPEDVVWDLRTDLTYLRDLLKEMGANIVRGPQLADWAPGYYYVLFEDPDEIRLEVCHVPGSGVVGS